MFSKYIIYYCDFIIKITTNVKNYFESNKIFENKLLSKENYNDADNYLNNSQKQSHKFHMTRVNRHRLYKLLKGRHSKYKVYSYGNENKFSKKNIIIIRN